MYSLIYNIMVIYSHIKTVVSFQIIFISNSIFSFYFLFSEVHFKIIFVQIILVIYYITSFYSM